MGPSHCKECERHFPGGKGLIDGRCRRCHADFLERHKEVKKPAAKSRRKGEED